jgi:hypothetical protein
MPATRVPYQTASKAGCSFSATRGNSLTRADSSSALSNDHFVYIQCVCVIKAEQQRSSVLSVSSSTVNVCTCAHRRPSRQQQLCLV